MKNKISINFVDFWPNFQKKDNYFFHLLSQDYDVKIEENDPDIVFGSFDYESKKKILDYKDHRSLKIYYTGENDGPRDFPYDVCMTQHRSDRDNHFRLPLWAFFTSWFGEHPFIHSRDPSFLIPWTALDKSKIDLEAIVNSKKKFCSFLYADATPERIKWFNEISSIGKVDSAGMCLNNTGERIPGRGDQIYKLAFLSDYFFSLAIENSSVNGYATEKLIHPMSTCVIPLYWGDSLIEEDVNLDSIIDLRKSPNEVVEEIKFLMNNKKNYIDKLEKSWFKRDYTHRYKSESLHFIKNCLKRKQGSWDI